MREKSRQATILTTDLDGGKRLPKHDEHIVTRGTGGVHASPNQDRLARHLVIDGADACPHPATDGLGLHQGCVAKCGGERSSRGSGQGSSLGTHAPYTRGKVDTAGNSKQGGGQGPSLQQQQQSGRER